jgi:hypothetical protein
MKHHFVHHRCKTPITIKGDRIYCAKCKNIIPFKSIGYWSKLANKFLKNNNITIGEALIDNIGDQVLLVDMEYIRREKKKKDKL